jgi:lysophospholipase L1-like esterase
MNKTTLIFIFLLCLVLAGFSPDKRKATIFTIGDSTMADKDTTGNNPERGWCQILPAFFDTRYVTIDNRAKNGRSSKSFIGEGLWQNVLNDLKKGDYVLIQFGHNDSKPDTARHTDPQTTYRANLVKYITETRKKGAHPILCTSIVRRSFDKDGNLVNTLSDYPVVTIEVGNALKVPVIDLNKATVNLLTEYGVEGSKALFMIFEPGVSKKHPNGLTDNTHLNPLGAFKVAELAVREMQRQKLGCTKYFLKGTLSKNKSKISRTKSEIRNPKSEIVLNRDLQSILQVKTSFRGSIDREALVKRHHVKVNKIDSLASLTVGNGNFAFTVDATGLQTFPEYYEKGIPLGTQAQWGWHSFPDTAGYQPEESLRNYNFRGREEPYSVQLKTPERARLAGEYLRANPHRLHLGIIGLTLLKKDGSEVTVKDITDPAEELDLWKGEIRSHFTVEGTPVEVITVCHPDRNMIAARVISPLIASGRLKIKFRFPYPTGNHTDAACNWNIPEKHLSQLSLLSRNSAIIKRELDSTVYYARVDWAGKAKMTEKQAHWFELMPEGNIIEFSCQFSREIMTNDLPGFELTRKNNAAKWSYFWSRGGAVDFSGSTDPRAFELEKRTVLSQYLMAIQCAGEFPPQETGLTYNSWYGKFHLEMHWWHAAHFALWNRIDLLEKSLGWYNDVLPVAQKIAARQGFKGARWMKMTDTTGMEAPSSVGSFLIWQQPHIIYFAELCYRNYHSKEILEKYKALVFETADFMASFATYDPIYNRYILKGIIPAQETLSPETTFNSPYELAYWHWGLKTAQEWRVRLGMNRDQQWDDIIAKIAVLAQKDGLYLSAESAQDSWSNLPYYSDHPAVLGALGVFPESRLVDKKVMNATFDYVWNNWYWKKTWGWDFPMVSMTATRLDRPGKAVDALFMNIQTNTYLPNGHNFQDARLRLYLPGNGSLLTAVALMCAGYDGCVTENPGIPKDGTWKVKWEGLVKMP